MSCTWNKKEIDICYETYILFSSVIARSRTPSANSMAHENAEVHLGERVLVVGQRTGIIRFYGKTSFAQGMTPLSPTLLSPAVYSRKYSIYSICVN